MKIPVRRSYFEPNRGWRRYLPRIALRPQLIETSVFRSGKRPNAYARHSLRSTLFALAERFSKPDLRDCLQLRASNCVWFAGIAKLLFGPAPSSDRAKLKRFGLNPKRHRHPFGGLASAIDNIIELTRFLFLDRRAPPRSGPGVSPHLLPQSLCPLDFNRHKAITAETARSMPVGASAANRRPVWHTPPR